MSRKPKYDIDPVELHRLYIDEQFSTVQIARQLGLFQRNGTADAPKIQRALLRYNIPIRSKSEAQTRSLKQGFSKHPTQGRTRTLSERLSIGVAVKDEYRLLSDDKKKQRAKHLREFWNNKDNQKAQQEVRRKIGEQLKKSVREGTYLERSIAKFLIQQGYSVVLHAKHILDDPSLECDMLVTGVGKNQGVTLVIEVDGGRHYQKWMNNTPHQLAEIIKADNRKNGLVISKPGNTFMLRILYPYGKDLVCVRAVLDRLNEILGYIKKVSTSSLSAKDRFIALDMKQCIEGKPVTDNPHWKAAMKILASGL